MNAFQKHTVEFFKKYQKGSSRVDSIHINSKLCKKTVYKYKQKVKEKTFHFYSYSWGI